MGNECVGSLSPQADLLGFAVAIMLASALALIISDSVSRPEGEGVKDITSDDLRSFLEWPGFDPDGDGILSAPRVDGPETRTSTGTCGRLVAMLCHDNEEKSFLFLEGRYEGEISNHVPASRIISVTVLLEHEGSTVTGTLSVFKAGGMS